MAILVVAFAVFASRQGGDGGDGPLNAIAEAAEKTQEEPGGRATMRAVASSPGDSEPLTMTGTMVFDETTDRTESVITVPNPESGGPVEMHMVTDGEVVYIRSDRFGALPDGSEWMALDFSSFTAGQEGPLPANGDAKGELELLESASGGVRKLGEEEVRGVPTTHYRGTVAVSERVEELREEGQEELADYVEENGGPLRVEAWIDADGLVRRTRLIHFEPGEDGEGTTSIDMRMDFFDFGITPEIDVPDSSEVFDATGLAEEEVGLSSE